MKEYDPREVCEKEMAFGITGINLKIEQKVRNWLTYKLRQCIIKQERIAYDKPNINNEKQIRLRFNKEITRETIYKYHLYRKDKNLPAFFRIINCKKKIFNIENEKIDILELL